MNDYEARKQSVEAMAATFEKYNDDYIKFERVENKRHNRADIHAFLLLDELWPVSNHRNIVCGADHDVIYLDADVYEVASKITDAQVLELVRCGVSYDADNCSFYMFA